jgi:hypothetical protein
MIDRLKLSVEVEILSDFFGSYIAFQLYIHFTDRKNKK